MSTSTGSAIRKAASGGDFRVRARRYLPHAIVACVACAVILWQMRLVGDFRIDDAYISLAFSKNLASGNGLIYGHDLRVEGYSNFLWVVICAGLKLLFPNALYGAARGVALVCLAATLVLTFRTVRKQASVSFACLAVLLLAFATDLTRAALSALETVPYVAALTFTAFAYLTEPKERRRASGYGLLILCLLRIDGIVHAAFFIGYEFVYALVERRFQVRAFLKWLLVPVVLYAFYFLWRYSYYGLLLPTTYYAKAELGIADPFRGLEYAWSSILELGIPILSLGAAFACGRRPNAARIFLAALVSVQIAYMVHVGGDWMPFNRFTLPILPALTVLFVWGVSDMLEAAERAPSRVSFAVAPLILGACIVVAILQDAHTVNTRAEAAKLGNARHVARHTAGLVNAKELYQWVLRRPGEKLVTDYGGVFAYYTDASIIEMWGLCNKDIALRGNTDGVNPIYGKTCIECYKEFNPDYFHANVPLARPIDAISNYSGVLAELFQGPALDRVLNFRQNYVAGRVVDTNRGLAFYFLERRRPGVSFEPRRPAPSIIVEYPFGS